MDLALVSVCEGPFCILLPTSTTKGVSLNGINYADAAAVVSAWELVAHLPEELEYIWVFVGFSVCCVPSLTDPR